MASGDGVDVGGVGRVDQGLALFVGGLALLNFTLSISLGLLFGRKQGLYNLSTSFLNIWIGECLTSSLGSS